MKEKFFDKKVDNFCEYHFSKDFFPNVFGKDYRRKYSLSGEGIFDLVFIKDKIYSISIKEAKSMVVNDNKTALRDAEKNILTNKIREKLQEYNIEYTMKDGKIITFRLGKYIAKLEIVQKRKMPENLGKTLIDGQWVD